MRKILRQLFLIDDSPHKVAAGAALGVFWGIMPGEGIATSLITAYFLRFNRLSATTGVLATNMWMTAATLPLATATGGKIFNITPELLTANFKETYKLGWEYFFTETIFTNLLLPLITGFIIISLVISSAFYFLLYFLLKYKKIRFK